MSDEDLIKRLRDFAAGTKGGDPAELCRRAADALEDINEQLRSMIEGMQRFMRGEKA